MLYGVKLSDLIDKPVVTSDPAALVTYTVMPEEYVRGGFWPKTSNLKCWDCHEVPTGQPAFIPVNYCRQEERSGVYGHFCSWHCAAARIQSHFPADRVADLLGSLRIVESHFSGSYKIFIEPSIPITELKEYKGPSGMTRATWEKANLARRVETASYRMADFDIGRVVPYKSGGVDRRQPIGSV